MTLKQIQEEGLKEYGNRGDYHQLPDGEDSFDFPSYTETKVILHKYISLAYKAGKDEVLEQVEREIDKNKKIGSQMLMDAGSINGLSLEENYFNSALSSVLSFINKLKK